MNFIYFFLLSILSLSAFSQSQESTNVDTLKIGNSSSIYNPTFEFAGTNIKVRGNKTTGKGQFTNDGSIWKDLGSGSGSGSGGQNILLNNSLEDGPGSWTNSGGTFTQESYTNTMEGDLRYGRLVASASGQYVETSLAVVPDNLGYGCQAQFDKYSTVTNGAWKFVVLDSSSNVLATQNIGVTNGFIPTPLLSFPCPAAGATFKLRLESLAAATINFDLAYGGSNRNLAQVNCQGTVECEDNFSVKIASGGATSDETLEWIGTCTPSSNILTCPFTATFSVAPNCSGNANSTTDGGLRIRTVSTTQIVFDVFNTNTGSASAQASILKCQRAAADFVKAKPQTAVLPSEQDWIIDANIGGGTPSLGISNQASYIPLEDAGLDMVLTSGSSPAKIPCATGSATGLTCSAVNEQVGATFTPPRAGWYEACIAFTHYGLMGAGTSVNPAFQLNQTSNTGLTTIQEGKTRVTAFTPVAGTSQTPLNVCGTYFFPSASETTIRLMYEQTVTGSTFTANSLLLDRNASVGQRDAHIIVKPLLSASNRLYLTGDQVTSKGENTGSNLYSAVVATGGSFGSSVGDWIASVTNIGTGIADINIKSGACSSVPNCSFAEHKSGAEANVYKCNKDLGVTWTNTYLRVRCHQNTGATPFNVQTDITCHCKK